MVAPATSPSSEDRAMWPPSKLQAKALRSASGTGSPGTPVSASAAGGVAGGGDRSTGVTSPRRDALLLRPRGSTGRSGGKGSWVQILGTAPTLLALRTVT